MPGFEAPAFIAGLNGLATMGGPVEKRGGHLCVAEDIEPFAEGQIGGGDDQSALVELADKMEQDLAASLGKR